MEKIKKKKTIEIIKGEDDKESQNQNHQWINSKRKIVSKLQGRRLLNNTLKNPNKKMKKADQNHE
jgi:hypothetical protein